MMQLDRRILEWSFFIYLSLVIMNSIPFINTIKSIGSVGKLFVCLLFLLVVFFFTKKRRIKFTLLTYQEALIYIGGLLLFGLVFMARTRTSLNLLPNLAFGIYFLFYYFLFKLLMRSYLLEAGKQTANIVRFKLLHLFRKTLFVNFVFWFVIAFGLGVNLREEDGSFGGFFQDEIHFGLFAVTGFLLSFYFRYNTIARDRSYFNLGLLVVYGIIVLMTSRNASLIIIAALAYYFFLSKIKNRFYRVTLFTLLIAAINLNFLLQNLTEAEIIEITSGRYQIWLFVIERMKSDSLFLIGNGLFNLNDIILRTHQGIGFYYLDTLESLSFHNSYVEILAAGGLILLIYFFKIVLKTWGFLSTVEKSIFISILVGAFFESYLVQPFMLIAVLFYLLLISHNVRIQVYKKEKTIETDSVLKSTKIRPLTGQL